MGVPLILLVIPSLLLVAIGLHTLDLSIAAILVAVVFVALLIAAVVGLMWEERELEGDDKAPGEGPKPPTEEQESQAS